jgi:cephalosporin-C deacetylase
LERYFDVLNFAPRITCPVLMNAGLVDTVSAPTTVQAAYLALKGPKEIMWCPNIGHAWSPAFDRYAWHWLDGVMKMK